MSKFTLACAWWNLWLFVCILSVNKILNGFFPFSDIFFKFDIFMGNRTNFQIDSVQIIIGWSLFSIIQFNNIFQKFNLKHSIG